MKKILSTLILVLCFVGVYSQDSTKVKTLQDSVLSFTLSGLTVNTMPRSYMYLRDNGELKIYGDTLSAIRELIKVYYIKDSILEAKSRLISACINFLNEIPDYWKSKEQNCKYGDWYAEITRNGYFITERKPRKQKPCN